MIARDLSLIAAAEGCVSKAIDSSAWWGSILILSLARPARLCLGEELLDQAA